MKNSVSVRRKISEPSEKREKSSEARERMKNKTEVKTSDDQTLLINNYPKIPVPNI